MPDFITHYYFGQTVLSALPDDLQIDRAVFDYALTGPDDWYFFFSNKQKLLRAGHMHRHQTGEFLCALSEEPALFSYLAGFLCHYFLDATCHPYIICRTGSYTGTAESRQYLGNHMAFEKALDLKILESCPDLHPIENALQNKKLPSGLRQPLDRVYLSVFGWKNVFQDLQIAKASFLRFLRCANDPHGVIKTITGAIPHPLVKAIPYTRTYYQSEDIFNESHQEWHHPNDVSCTSTRSFPELIADAREQAAAAIVSVKRNDLSLIGNRSYITGLDLSDPRNKAKESYQLLNRYRRT